jgi:hypothetical protein
MVQRVDQVRMVGGKQGVGREGQIVHRGTCTMLLPG